MKAIGFLGFLTLICLPSAVSAAESRALDFSDIDVVAVSPRSASDRPFLMVVFPKKTSEQTAANIHGKSKDAGHLKSATR